MYECRLHRGEGGEGEGGEGGRGRYKQRLSDDLAHVRRKNGNGGAHEGKDEVSVNYEL